MSFKVPAIQTNVYWTSMKFIQRKGNLSYTKAAFDQCAYNLLKKEKLKLFTFFPKLFKRFPFLVEIKTVKMRKKQVKHVPFPTNPVRRAFLRKKLLFSFLGTSSRNQNLKIRLNRGFLEWRYGASKNATNSFRKFYKDHLIKVRACKSNMNFRWC